MNGRNDQAMVEPKNRVSDGVNWVVNQGMDVVGYNTRRRPPEQDNSFYRDQAQHMPGWPMPGSGLPSGAHAQDRATNYVGHSTKDFNSNQTWDNVRRRLVIHEGSRIQQLQAAGESGRLGFTDLYRAHADAYDRANRNAQNGQVNSTVGGHNGFIDPASFALAVYGAPALEAIGINSGPLTGTSIDLVNDPTDSATRGWAKRMALSGAEIGAGAALATTGQPLVGAGLIGAGAFSGAWNTVTAVRHGMLGEVGREVGNGARAMWSGASHLASRAGGAVSGGLRAAGRGIGNAVSGAGRVLSSGASAISSGLSEVGHSVSTGLHSTGRAIRNGVSAPGHGFGQAAPRAGDVRSGG